jgi:hypothetical protein
MAKTAEEKKAYHAAYYAAHSEKLRAYRAARAEKKRAYGAVYYAENRERLRARQAAYNAAHVEERRAQQAAYGVAHREEHRARNAAYRGRHPTEAKVEKHLVDCVKSMGGMCPKFNDPGRRGAPDRIVCIPGYPAYFVELKRPKLGKLDTHQVRYHNDLRAAGQRVWVLWSKENVDAFIAEVTLT